MQAVAINPGQPGSAHLTELEKPEHGPGEMLVRVLETGICGTDIEINSGLYGTAPAGQSFLVLGHESFGVIEDLDEKLEAQGWQPGDYVVCTVRRPCHEADPNCQHGASDMCITGNYTERGIKERNGYMTEYYTEVPDFAIKVPHPYRDFGVLLEPTSVVEKAIAQAYKIQERLDWQPKRAVVLGAGPIGLLGTFLLRNLGLEVYTVATRPAGPNNLKSQLAERCGATYVSSRDTALEDFPKRFGPIDFIIEATGVSSLAFEAMGIMGINGVLALTGVSGGQGVMQIPSDKLNIDIVLGNRVIFGSVNANRNYFEAGVQHWGAIEQKWPGLLKSVITRRLPIGEYKQALEKDPDGIKTVLAIGA